jgi:hypothetical protein
MQKSAARPAAAAPGGAAAPAERAELACRRGALGCEPRRLLILKHSKPPETEGRQCQMDKPMNGQQGVTLIFCQGYLQRIDFQIALGEQPLEAGILPFQLSQPLGVWHGHATELLAPAVECLLADPVLTAQHTDGLLAMLGLVQHMNLSHY